MIPYILTIAGAYLIGNSVTEKFKRGGETESQDTMWKVKPSTMAEDMIEAKELLGATKWNALSSKEKVETTKYLKFKGEIGLPGQEESIEDISALQYYAKGGKLIVNDDDFSFLLKMSDKELSKRLDLIRMQQAINSKQYFSAKDKNESTTKIEEARKRLDNQERAIIEARNRK